MVTNTLSQAQAFWNKTKAAGWSDEETRLQSRREAGVIQHAGNMIFSDGSMIAFHGSPPVRERNPQPHLRMAAIAN